MIDDDREGFLDGTIMRIVAGVVIVACVGVLAYLNRDNLVEWQNPGMGTGTNAGASGLNPEFIKCRDERGAQVDKMLTDGMITQDRLAVFKERATEICAGQFPSQI